MGRRKKIDIENEIQKQNTDSFVFEKDLPVMNLNEYLSNYSKKRNLDKAITLWYRNKDSSNPKFTKQIWDKIIDSFYNETER